MKNRLSNLKRPLPEFPRAFVPDDIDLGDWNSFEPLFNELLNRKINSREALEKWFLDESELFAVMLEENARLRVATACATEDKDAEAAFIGFMQNIVSKASSMEHQLNLKEVASPYLNDLDPYRYEVRIRETRNSIDLFREENIPLQIDISRLTQQYQRITGSMMVNYRGEELTLQQAAIHAESVDRTVRGEVFKLFMDCWMKEAGKLDDLFDQLLKKRMEIAKNAGFNDYPTFIFRTKDRFDYTPEDCLQFHDTLEKQVVPINRKLLEERRIIMGLETVKPWDTSNDPYGREPLRPFKDVSQLIQGCLNIFRKVDTELGDQFQTMIDLGLLDLESRKGKMHGGFQMPLSEVRLPFIFMNASGMHQNVITLLHEGGHAFHQFATRQEPLLSYRRADAEFAEVASMTMELMGGEHLDEFYNTRDTARACRSHFERTIAKLPSIGLIDGFQHWLYTHPGHTSEERVQAWTDLLERFSSGVDWEGCEEFRKYSWHGVPHIFGMPFYFIEYGIAQLGALQIWRNSCEDKQSTLDAYKSALRLGGSRPLPELFETAGIKFDFTDQILEPLIEEVFTEVERLGKLERA